MFRILSSFLLGAALLAPVAAVAQDRDEHRDARRYYDRDHRDYHQWNDGENQAYQRFMQERHIQNRNFAKLNRRQQAEYWKWRHEHEEHERR